MLSFLISNEVSGLSSVQVLLSLKEGKVKHTLNLLGFFHPTSYSLVTFHLSALP